jgi:hypothetical protein
MTTARFLTLALALMASLFTVGPAFARAGDGMNNQVSSGQLVPVTDKTDAAWLAKAQAGYPLNTCTVSGDKLDSGDMGKPQDFIYKEDGKPDRLVRFCCKDCLKDFNKDQAKYLKIIDDAAAAKAKDGKS